MSNRGMTSTMYAGLIGLDTPSRLSGLCFEEPALSGRAPV